MATPDHLLIAQLNKLQALRELIVEAEKLDEVVEEKLPSELSAARFYNDPAGFALQCIDWGSGGLTAYQQDILVKLPAKRRVAVRGPHGLGKSTLSAVAVLWFALTRDAAGVDWKVATTAGAWRQLIRYLWPEIHKWAKRIKWSELGRGPLDEHSELLSLNIKLIHGSAFAVASSNAELIEGVHADSVMYIFDESKAIGASIFEAAEGAFSGADPAGGLPEAYALACSTPGEPNGVFYDIHARKPGLEDWWARHVTLAEAAAAKRVSMVWAEQRKAQWGANSAAYNNRVLGEFYSSDEDGVIPLSWIEAAQERWRQWVEDGSILPEDGPRVVAVDVARTGTDKTVLAIRYGNVLTELRRTHLEVTTVTTGRVVGALNAITGSRSIVDVIGIGAGVVDQLREQNQPCEAFNASKGTTMRDKSNELGFTNCRAAAWWNLREMLDPSNNSELAIPDDELLVGDLTAPHWRIMSGGKIQVEPKDEIRKRLGRSPDDGDAVVMAYWSKDGDWSSAYGVVTCSNCSRGYVASLHKTHCPFCRTKRPTAGE